MDTTFFKVQFPSKADLDGMKIFCTCRVPNSVCEITIDSWLPRVEPMVLVPQVWVRMSGIPSKHKGDFLALWSMGMLFGKTLKVDMPFTREYGILCIHLAMWITPKFPRTFWFLLKMDL